MTSMLETMQAEKVTPIFKAFLEHQAETLCML